MNKRQAEGPIAKMLGKERTDEVLADLLETAKSWLTPLDLDALVADGVLEKKGAWYRIVKPEALPEHAKKKISTVSQQRLPNGEMGESLVKFHKPLTETKRREFEKIVKRIEG